MFKANHKDTKTTSMTAVVSEVSGASHVVLN